MSKFHDSVDVKPGYNSALDKDAGLNFIDGFGVLKLDGSGPHKDMAPEHETALIIYSGTCTVCAGDKVYENIGGRKSVFDGLPTAVYIPPGIEFSIGSDDAELGI